MKPTFTLPTIFQDVASSKASHKKNLIALRKLASSTTSPTTFEHEFFLVICRVLTAKKGNMDAENVLRFLKLWFEYMENSQQDETLQYMSASSLSEYLLLNLMPGLDAGNKVIRYRVCQIILILLNFMDEIDDDLFIKLRLKLLERSRDKEALVRVQASIALCRLQDGDEDLEIVQRLLELMQYDPSLEVRKNVIGNSSITPLVLPCLVKRVCDQDAFVRTSVFEKLLTESVQLPLDQLVFLLTHGLSDRNPMVRKKCLLYLFENWCVDDSQEFLTRLNVMENKEIAKECLKAYFMSQSNLNFPYESLVWDDLNPEKILFIQQYSCFCLEAELLDEYEEALPDFVVHIEYLKKYTQLMMQSTSDSDKLIFEFIVGELLLIASQRDFSDETGRRECLDFSREFLVHTDVDELHIQTSVKCIQKIAMDELDFLRIIADVLYDIEETLVLTEDMTTDEKEISQSVVMLKCLDIIKSAFSLCRIPASENEPMNGILSRFVLPCLQYPRIVLRCAGMEALGLCCLLDKTMAHDNFKLFEFGVKCADKQLVVICLSLLLDFNLLYGVNSFDDIQENVMISLLETFLECFEQDVLTLAVEGSCKLLLLDENLKTFDNQILLKLVLCYYHPYTKDMKRIRQCLDYFFQVYCFSNVERQSCMSKIFVDILEACMALSDTFPEMPSPSQIVLQIIEWTDVKRLFNKPDTSSLHESMLVDMLAFALEKQMSVVFRRAICQSLCKFNLLQESDLLRDIESRTMELMRICIGDSVSTNALKRFCKVLSELSCTTVIESTHTTQVEEPPVEQMFELSL